MPGYNELALSLSFIDASGWQVPADRFIAGRLVSLVPGLTEALCGLGLGDRLAGVTRFCEEPAAQLASLPRVGGTKDPDLAAIRRLHPDLVIASKEENREVDIVALRASGISVFVTHYPTVQSAIDGISLLARMLGGDDDCTWLHDARDELGNARARSTPPVRYFCPIWRRPYMVARSDTYMADLLALAGGSSSVPDQGKAHYFPVTVEDLLKAAPDVIVLPDEPFRFQARHIAEFAPLHAIPAVRHHRIHLADGKALTWYGPRIAPALRYFSTLFDAARQHIATEAGS